MDYVNSGEEHICLADVQTSVVAPIIALKGRGLNLPLERTFADGSVSYDSNGYDKNPLAINNQWRWSLPCFFTYDGNFTLYLTFLAERGINMGRLFQIIIPLGNNGLMWLIQMGSSMQPLIHKAVIKLMKFI
ncbi:hypothetical protein [Hydrogenispora ethanolica]|uniref:hypothetical protein n=1 Tax=Hydrogenispora ethanolica TaxID=1082276 RepID=UPI00104A6E83|nr:hypothetical protein [Hydrogenispora ethanolica]